MLRPRPTLPQARTRFRSAWCLRLGILVTLTTVPAVPVTPWRAAQAPAPPCRASAQPRRTRSLFASGAVTPPWSLFTEDPHGAVRAGTGSQSSPQQVVSATLREQYLEASWSGAERGVLGFDGHPRDYRLAARGGVALVVRYQVLERPTRPVLVGMRCAPPHGDSGHAAGSRDWRSCGSPFGAVVDLLPLWSSVPLQRWRTLVLPLHCLTAGGAELADVGAPLIVDTAGSLTLRIGAVRFGSSAAPCPAQASRT